jgi:phosphoglycolate phosphatase
LIYCMEGRRALETAFYRHYGIENGFHDIKMAGRLDAFIVRDAFKKNDVDEEEIDLFLDTYCSILQEIMQTSDTIFVLPGVKEILKNTISNFNIHHALATGNIEKAARIKLKHYDLDEYFPVGGFGDHELERWEIVEQAIKRAQDHYGTRYQKENIYVIGDTPLDIECGKILGIKSIAVSTGPYDEEKLKPYFPDYLFSDLRNHKQFLNIFK